MRRVPWPAAHCPPDPPEEPSMSTATIRSAETRPPLIAALGGTGGLLDGGVPPLLFVAVNAIAGPPCSPPAPGRPAFFLPGFWVDAAYAVAFAASAVIGRPLGGIAYGLRFGLRA